MEAVVNTFRALSSKGSATGAPPYMMTSIGVGSSGEWNSAKSLITDGTLQCLVRKHEYLKLDCIGRTRQGGQHSLHE